MKLSYSKVFDRYTMSFSDKLAELSYSLYKTLRLRLTKYSLFQNTRNIGSVMIHSQRKNLLICRKALII